MISNIFFYFQIKFLILQIIYLLTSKIINIFNLQQNQSNKSNPKENIPENKLDAPVIQAFRNFDKTNAKKITFQEFKLLICC